METNEVNLPIEFDKTESELKQLASDNTNLVMVPIDHPDFDAHYTAVVEGGKSLKNARLDIEKRRKFILEPLKTFTNKVNEEAKRLQGFINPTEDKLREQVVAIKKQLEERQHALELARAEKLRQLGYSMKGAFYVRGVVMHEWNTLRTSSDAVFAKIVTDTEREIKNEQIRAEAEAERLRVEKQKEVERKAENARIQAEAARLEAEKNAQIEENTRIQAENARMQEQIAQMRAELEAAKNPTKSVEKQAEQTKPEIITPPKQVEKPTEPITQNKMRNTQPTQGTTPPVQSNTSKELEVKRDAVVAEKNAPKTKAEQKIEEFNALTGENAAAKKGTIAHAFVPDSREWMSGYWYGLQNAASVLDSPERLTRDQFKQLILSQKPSA